MEHIRHLKKSPPSEFPHWHAVNLYIVNHGDEENMACDLCEKISNKYLKIKTEEGGGWSMNTTAWICEDCMKMIMSLFKEN